jgi:hypothetical protein
MAHKAGQPKTRWPDFYLAQAAMKVAWSRLPAQSCMVKLPQKLKPCRLGERPFSKPCKLLLVNSGLRPRMT